VSIQQSGSWIESTRKTLGFETPAGKLQESVASTGPTPQEKPLATATSLEIPRKTETYPLFNMHNSSIVTIDGLN
jgi:hypothetical protein